MWVTGVFQEYNIAIDGLFCTVTEGSSDPSRLCLKIESSKWEWSFPQMLHSALVEVSITRANLILIGDYFQLDFACYRIINGFHNKSAMMLCGEAYWGSYAFGVDATLETSHECCLMTRQGLSPSSLTYTIEHLIILRCNVGESCDRPSERPSPDLRVVMHPDAQ